MYNVISDITTGYIEINQSWETEKPILLKNNDLVFLSYTNISDIETLKSIVVDYTGGDDDNYIYKEYRVSPNQKRWSEWMVMEDNIENFPPFTSTYDLFFDVRLIKKGDDETPLTINSLIIKGSIARNVITGLEPFTVVSGTSVIVKPPYIYTIFKITDVEILSKSDTNLLDVKYRFSQDNGRNVTQWEKLTKNNITSVRISPSRFFQIEYLINTNSTTPIKVNDINIIGEVVNVSLNYTKSNFFGLRENCASDILNIICENGGTTPVGEGSGTNTPITDDCVDKDKLFKPYDLPAGTKLQDDLINSTNEIFGHKVVYFLTAPNEAGIDYTFHEYQLHDYVAHGELKISVANNDFPDPQIVTDMFDLNIFDAFEVTVPRKAFKNIFGVEKRPGKEDRIWFCNLNRMYRVETSQSLRKFNNQAFEYKLILKKHNQDESVSSTGNSEIDEILKLLNNNTTTNELIGYEKEQDKQSVTKNKTLKPKTLNDVRLGLFALIIKEKILNSNIEISTNCYDMSTVRYGDDAVIYDNFKNKYKDSDNLGFTCWFRINNYDLSQRFNLIDYYNNEKGFKIDIFDGKLIVKLNKVEKIFDVEEYIDVDIWYSIVVNINQRNNKLSYYLYKRNTILEEDAIRIPNSKLLQLSKDETDIDSVNLKINDRMTIKASDMLITNIRLFVDVIDEKEHNVILNKKTYGEENKYLLLADNADEKLILPRFKLSQTIKDDEY